MKNIQLILLILISFTGYAQCPTGNVTLVTQIDVNNFADNYPNCMNLSGIMTIGGNNSDISDLTALSSLEYVGGLMIINTDLTSLDGLENLQAITTGSLSILGNTNLTDVQALNHTIWIPELNIVSNPNLSQCNAQAICDQVNATNTIILGNNYLCNSTTEVDLTCGFSTTQLITADCGAQMNTFDQTFYAEPVSGATEYEFEFTDTQPPYNVVSVQTTNPETSLQEAGIFDINKTFDVKVRALVNGIWIFYGPVCQIYSPSPIVPVTQITQASCGQQLTAFNELFYADAVPGATEYEFLFIDSDNILLPKISLWTNTAHSLQIPVLLDVDKTYDVQVRAKVNGVWGIFGPICQIHSPNSVPTTQLKALHCGEQLSAFNEVFYADAVSGATQYEFLFVNTGTLAPSNFIWTNPGHSLILAGLLELGVTYEVQVRAFVGGTWGDYGPICLLHAPLSLPTSKIRNQDCGITLSAYNQIFKCDHVPGADQYRFRFNGGGLINYEHDRPNFSTNLNLAGLQTPNITYDVDVKARVGGAWGDYSVNCQITSPPNPPILQPNETVDVLDVKETSEITADIGSEKNLDLKIYPNPANQQFTVSTSLKNYSVNLYEASGQLILTNSALNGNQNIDVLSFDSGMYILQILNAENILIETRKVSIVK